MKKFMMKAWVVYIQAFFYSVAGLNHFLNPDFYLPLIPEYLPNHGLINLIAGFIEILLGLGILFKNSRKWAGYGIVVMLISFIPSHIYIIQIGGCVGGGLCVPLWIAWVRLLFIHPLLLIWAISLTHFRFDFR
ncbi:hypothetical protein [Algoriphagus sanaruensis]|uniref:DoxX family protein n=1 Tax=Algoriphagus sanaruensis TaxID=1727163 RepID=A0A142ENW3_9BACT|nr:hypothetical protein [Algoriphagus sanaruensis]AMQ56818.1 hypothetical protein AO498_10290 [Algoriphagus sanaruensis]